MKTACLLMTTLGVLMLTSCLEFKHNGSNANLNSCGRVTRTTYSTDMDSCVEAFVKKGKVYVRVCRSKLNNDNRGTALVNDGVYEVKNLDVPIVSILIDDIGPDYNPVLCMIREDCQVQMLSLFESIYSRGFFYASYPLNNLKNIVKLKSENFGENVGIVAVDSRGIETEVPYNPVAPKSYSMVDSNGISHTLFITPEWLIVYRRNDTRDTTHKSMVEYVGEYDADVISDEPVMQDISFVFRKYATGRHYFASFKQCLCSGSFTLSIPYDDKGINITKNSGEELDLPKGKEI